MAATTSEVLGRRFVRPILSLAVALAAGCAAIGPSTVPRDRLDYAGAIADSWREQTLLNIVKLRYFDAPAFLEVSSVISSYSLESQVSLEGKLFPSSPTDTNRTLGASGTYTDHPTISYTPVTGKKYINSLLRPIPPEAIFAMIQGGHPADYILGLSAEAINGVYNYSTGPARARREDPAFNRVIGALRRLQQAGALEIRSEKRDHQEATLIGFRPSVSPEVDQDIRLVRETLGISPQSKELQLTFGATRHKGDQISLLTRSMLEILANLSSGVDVPKQHIAEGRATRAAAQEGDAHLFPITHIHSNQERPADAYAAVHYRGYWFWIDDRDLDSKRVFTFLMVFSSIAETGTVPQVPILTIPAN
jgi:hypothetical protein